MEYDEAYDYLLNQIKILHPSIVPLFKMNKEKRFPEFVGSSVYCKLGPKRLLLSAEHVLTDIFPDKVLYPYSNSLIEELPCNGVKKHKNSKLDVGVVELIADLPMWSPIDSSSFGSFNSERSYQHLLVGYPASSTKNSDRTRTKIELKGYLTDAANENEYERLNVSPVDKLIVTFKKQVVFAENMRKMTFPNPNGMSGGAVFQFHERAPTQLSLVGVMNEWDTQKKTAIIATRIEKYTGMFIIRKLVDPSSP